MPETPAERMTWTVEDGDAYVTVRTAGRFRPDDHRAMVADIVGRPSWKPGRAALFDHRALSFDGTDYSTMWVAARTHRAHDREIGDGRAAILMSGPADYGLGRMFSALAEDDVKAQVRVFTDEAAALAWLTSS